MLPDAGLSRLLCYAAFVGAAFVSSQAAQEVHQGLADLRQLRRELLIAPRIAVSTLCTRSPRDSGWRPLDCKLTLAWREGEQWASVCEAKRSPNHFAFERAYRIRLVCQGLRGAGIDTVVYR